MTRLRGRAPVGERLVGKVPHGHWRTTTLVAALDRRGVRCAACGARRAVRGVRCAACGARRAVDGAVSRDVFGAFVEQVLAPALSPGDVVVLDNLSSHKGARAKALIEGAGAALLFLPPYSPGPEPDRAGVRQAQAAAAVGRAPHRRRAVVRRAADARPDHAQRRRQLRATLRPHATGGVGVL